MNFEEIGQNCFLIVSVVIPSESYTDELISLSLCVMNFLLLCVFCMHTFIACYFLHWSFFFFEARLCIFWFRDVINILNFDIVGLMKTEKGFLLVKIVFFFFGCL